MSTKVRATNQHPVKTPTPSQLAEKLGLLDGKESFVLIHPEGSKFSFKLFWRNRDYKGGTHEIIAAPPQEFKTKRECIAGIRKLRSFFGDPMFKSFTTYDSEGKSVDTETKIRYVF